MSPRYDKSQKKYIGKWVEKPIALECWLCGEEWVHDNKEGCRVHEFIYNISCPNEECDSTIHLFTKLGGKRTKLDQFFG